MLSFARTMSFRADILGCPRVPGSPGTIPTLLFYPVADDVGCASPLGVANVGSGSSS